MASDISWLEAVVLGAVEGLTEFLPVSSTGHLTILEKSFGLEIDDPDVTAFTAIIQVGAVLATIVFLRKDIVRIALAFLRGLRAAEHRSAPDYRFAWAVILGSIPIGIIGLAFKDTIETTFRSLWFVGSALIVWSFAMWFADSRATQERDEADVTWRDTLIIGTVQCLALIPGVSRSGATMSAGLLRGIDRVTVTRLSFFLSIPALTAAGILQSVDEYDRISAGVGWGSTLIAHGRLVRRRARGRVVAAALHRRPHLQRLHRVPDRARRARARAGLDRRARRDLTGSLVVSVGLACNHDKRIAEDYLRRTVALRLSVAFARPSGMISTLTLSEPRLRRKPLPSRLSLTFTTLPVLPAGTE